LHHSGVVIRARKELPLAPQIVVHYGCPDCNRAHELSPNLTILCGFECWVRDGYPVVFEAGLALRDKEHLTVPVNSNTYDCQ